MLNLKNNYYNVDYEKKEMINNILSRYLQVIYNEQDSVSNDAAVYYTLFLSEVYPLINDKDFADEIIYSMINKIRDKIENGDVLGISLFNGLSEVGLALYAAKKNTNHYGKFLKTINNIICYSIEENIKYYYEEMRNLAMQQFECIYGLAGVTTYLLYFKNDEIVNSALKKSLRYLVEITKDKEVYGKQVPGWHISSEKQFREELKEKYPKGNFNFGLSHGIAGPLVALSKAYNEGVIVKGQKEAIKKIINFYMKFKDKDEDGNTCWPTLLKYEEYINGLKVMRDNKKVSWCYGSIGIARALYFAGEALGDKETRQLSVQIMESIALLPEEKYYLISPTLCHGYAGVLSILNAMWKDTNSVKIKSGVINLTNIILKYYDPDIKYGFLNVNPTYSDKPPYFQKEDKNDFLEGGTGVMLALLSLFKNNTIYERHLLID